MSDTPNVPARPVLPGETERNVSLREFEQRLFTLQQQINDALRFQRELVETRSASLEKALELQAKEYERRLNTLNHAHDQAVKEQARVLSRDMFEQFEKEYHLFRLDTAKQLQAISTRSLTWTAAMGLVLAILSLVIRFWPAGSMPRVP